MSKGRITIFPLKKQLTGVWSDLKGLFLVSQHCVRLTLVLRNLHPAQRSMSSRGSVTRKMLTGSKRPMRSVCGASSFRKVAHLQTRCSHLMNHCSHLCSARSGDHSSACIPNNNFTQERRLLFGFTVAIVLGLVFVSIECGVLHTIPKTNGIIRGHRDTVETQLIFFLL